MIEWENNKTFKKSNEKTIVVYTSNTSIHPANTENWPEIYQDIKNFCFDKFFKHKKQIGLSNALIQQYDIENMKLDFKRFILIFLPIKQKRFVLPDDLLESLEAGLKCLIDKVLPELFKKEHELEFKKEEGIAMQFIGNNSLIPAEKSQEIFERILKSSETKFRIYHK